MMQQTVVPEKWFDGTTPWYCILARRFRYLVHINRGEIHAAVFLLAMLCWAGLRPRSKILDLCDSRVGCGVWAKGRSSSFALNQEGGSVCSVDVAALDLDALAAC